jgi:hypothetical protein
VTDRSLQMQIMGRSSGRSFFPLPAEARGQRVASLVSDKDPPLYFFVELPSLTSLTNVRTKLCGTNLVRTRHTGEAKFTRGFSASSSSINLINHDARRLVSRHPTIHCQGTAFQCVANAILNNFA